MLDKKYYVKVIDRTHEVFGRIEKGDSIFWFGDYYNKEKSDSLNTIVCDLYQSGVNKVKSLYQDGSLIWMVLDNNKMFIINNMKHKEIVFDGWLKLN